LTKSATQTIRFPHRRSVGTLYVAPLDQPEEWELLTQVRGLIVSPENQPIKWEWLEEARGNVTFPADHKIKLKLTTKGTMLSALDGIEPDALHALDLGHSEVSDNNLFHVSRLTGLRVLELNSTNIGDQGLEHLKALANLQSLGLSHSHITSKGLSNLSGLEKLREIWMSGTDVEDSGLASLHTLSLLVQLGLSGTKVTDNGLLELAKLVKLLRVYLFNSKVTHNGTQAFRQLLPKCRVKWHPTKTHEQDLHENEFDAERLEPLISLVETAAVMDERFFWKIIESIDWEKAGDDAVVIQPAVDALAQLSVEDICAFAEILAEKLYMLDGEAYAKEIGSDAFAGQKGDFAQNWFLYVRCCAVANGKETFDQILADPKEMPKDIEFQALLSIAPKAYKKKTGQRFNYSTRLSYETFSNKEAWVSS